MAINLDRFNPSSRANSHRNHNDHSNKPAIERMLTNLFEPHALDDTDSFPTQDSIPLADWETMSDIDASTSRNAEVFASPNEEVLTDGLGTSTERKQQTADAGKPVGGTIRTDLTTAMPDADKSKVHVPKTELAAGMVVESDGSEEQVDVAAADIESAEVDSLEAEEPTVDAIEADASAEKAPDLEPNAAKVPDAEQVTPVPDDDVDRTMAASFTPTLVRLPVPPKRGSVPKFLADFEAKRNPDDTAMRPLPYYNFNWMNESPNTRNVQFADLDEDYDDDYDDVPDDGFDTYYDECDDGYDYDDNDERRPRRKTLIALVAAVAVISFVAGGAVVRLSSQVPVLFGDKPETNETQASYSEPPKEQTLPEQAPAPEEISQVQTEPQPEAPQTPNDQQSPAEPEGTTPNPPSYDTGDDTADDWSNTDSDSQQDSEESPGSSDDYSWQWDLDQDGSNSISYNQNDNEVTFNYDGYQLTVPIGEIIGYNEHPDTSSPYDNDTLYENDGTDTQRHNDYGTGYDTEASEPTRMQRKHLRSTAAAHAPHRVIPYRLHTTP